MALKETLDQAVALLSSIRAESYVLQDESAPAPEPAPPVDPAALKVLQDKVDALAKENVHLRLAIKAEIDDQQKDSARLEEALAPLAEPAPVPVVDVETVSSAAKAEEKSPDDPAKPVSSGIQ